MPASEHEGACLFLKDRAVEDKILESCQSFRKYAAEHEPNWSEFFKSIQYNHKVSGIVLVTGVVKTSGWGIAVFAGGTSEQTITFSAPVGAFASTGGGISFQNIEHPQMTLREGPSIPPVRLTKKQNPDVVQAPNTPPPRDQTIFLRYVKIRYRFFRLLRQVVAASEMHDDGHSDSSEPELEPGEGSVCKFLFSRFSV